MRLSPGDRVSWDGGSAVGVIKGAWSAGGPADARAALGGAPSDPLLLVARDDGREVLRFAHEVAPA